MAFVQILPGETDANSPLNQTLFDKLRGNQDYFYYDRLGASGHNHNGTLPNGPQLTSAAYGAGSVDQPAIGASAVGLGQMKVTFGDMTLTTAGGAPVNQQFRFGYNFLPFWPGNFIQNVATASAHYVRVMENNPADPTGSTPPGVFSSIYNFVWMQFTSSGGNAFTSRFYYIQATRNDPTVFLLYEKATNRIVAAMFMAEVKTKDDLHPFPYHWNDPTHECVALELNRSDALRTHLFFDNLREKPVTVSIIDLIKEGKIVLKNEAEPIVPAEFGIPLHGPNLKNLNFDYLS